MKAYKVYVQLASTEWGNELMAQIAKAVHADPKYAKYTNLIVSVQEHGGWFLEYLKDGTIVYTANDSAKLCPAAQEFWRECRDVEAVDWINRGKDISPANVEKSDTLNLQQV